MAVDVLEPDLECWAIVEDKDELRLIHGVYITPQAAIEDAGALQPVRFVEVVPFAIHRSAQWSSGGEPALEQTDDDFDVALELDETPGS